MTAGHVTTTGAEAPSGGRAATAGRAAPAVAGVLGLAAFVGAVLAFPDPLGGARTAGEAAARLAGVEVQAAVLMLAASALLGLVVVAALARRVGPVSGAGRMIPVLGTAHLMLNLAGFAALAAAVTVGTQIFDGISAASVETALVIMNTTFPLAQWTGAAFGIAVLVASRRTGGLRALGVAAGVLALGLLSPFGWAAVYLMPLWFAAAGIVLALSRR